MKNKQNKTNQAAEERYSLKDFGLTKPEVVRASTQVVPRYERG
jgi:hypothetical protein